MGVKLHEMRDMGATAVILKAAIVMLNDKGVLTDLCLTLYINLNSL
jgi:hypothetical protein